MKFALEEAQKGALEGEVPVGAVITLNDEIIAQAHNLTETLNDPTAHAEMLVIKEASQKLGRWRLTGCSLYVTIEPCSMCAGAIVWSRIDNLYIGADDPKAGACGSVLNIVENEKLNHQVKVHRGILREQCSNLMREFFSNLRKRNKIKKENKQNKSEE